MKDLARTDHDGYFWFVGRKDDVIKASGYRIAPHEVEETLCRHPAVTEAAVIGVPDPDRGTRIIAYIVPRDRSATKEALDETLRQLVRDEHSSFARPREIHFVDTIPRSSSGKIDRSTLRRTYATAHRMT